MRLALTTGALLATCASSLSAEEIGDPIGLVTHEQTAKISYWTMSDSRAHEFAPASALSECLHAEIGEEWWSRIGTIAQCSDTSIHDDLLQFEWANENLSFPDYGVTATGSSMTCFSTSSDAVIRLDTIANLGDLAGSAEWSIEIVSGFDVVGTLEEVGDAFQVVKDVEYQLVFTMGGLDTRTTDGSTVSWRMAVAYGQGVVPGSGGLAMLVGLGAGRRRRRR